MPLDLATSISAILDAHSVGATGALQTVVPGLRLVRSASRVQPRHMEYRPSLCIVAQGMKQVLVGDTTLEYGAMQSMLITVDVPVLAEIVEASPHKPFIGITLNLDLDIILDVATRLDSAAYAQRRPDLGLVVGDVDDQLASSVLRLLDLPGRPNAIEILYPAVMREISYCLLTGPAGRNVAGMVLPAGQNQRVATAIRHLRKNFDAPVNVAALAKTAGMSASSFHQHFKALTSMSPLQYQKHLRLLEARRRMVADGEKAGVAAHSVGYESVSQFSREYARMFGAPPRRETQRAIVERGAGAAADVGRAILAAAR